MNINFTTIIALCIFQILILIGVLGLRRFRNFVNLFLAAVLVVMLLKYCFYLLYFNGVFDHENNLIYSIRILQIMPPPILWLYSSAILSGSIIIKKRMLLHGLPIAFSFLFFIPQIIESISPEMISAPMDAYNRWYGLAVGLIAGVLFFVYSQFIFLKLLRLYGSNKNLISCMLDFSHQHLTLLKVLSIMMNFYGLLLILQGFGAFYAESTPTIYDYLDSGFLVLLSYLMIFILVSIPKVIHYKYSKLSKTDKLLKYENSSLLRSEAIEYMQEMNGWMESEQPYLDSGLSLADMTEHLHLPGHIISEVLNGLLKQNFYDYINNYRVEEFKRISQLSENAQETNLNLAYSAGFNSKTTFNTAFKKFTSQTPTQFRTGLKA